jgi:hypothetical protein
MASAMPHNLADAIVQGQGATIIRADCNHNRSVEMPRASAQLFQVERESRWRRWLIRRTVNQQRRKRRALTRDQHNRALYTHRLPG